MRRLPVAYPADRRKSAERGDSTGDLIQKKGLSQNPEDSATGPQTFRGPPDKSNQVPCGGRDHACSSGGRRLSSFSTQSGTRGVSEGSPVRARCILRYISRL